MTRAAIGRITLLMLLIPLAVHAAGTPLASGEELHIGSMRVNKLLFLGNSITLHGPAESIGWLGNWGMAASSEDKDFVHLLATRIGQAAGGKPELLVRNVADFERQFETFDVAAGLSEAIAFEADVIVIAIGENVPALGTLELRAAYQEAFVRLLRGLRRNSRQVIFVRSTFWNEPIRNERMAAACKETGDVYVDQAGLDQNEAHFARSERKFDHAGVAAHPGDRGMQAIADGLWNAIERYVAGGNWPEFRGPTADGQATVAGLPLTWSETEHVAWKTPIHDLGWSSPVVWQKQIWLTTARDDGSQLFAISVNRDSGQIVHDVKVFDVAKPDHVATVNSYASPTPAVDEQHVYVHYGTYGTACLDRNTAQIVWTRRDLNCDHHEGPGSSPILFENLVIVHVDGRDVQYVIALDKSSGQTVWKTERSVDYSQYSDNMRKAFCTPTVVESVLEKGTRLELISPAAKAIFGYDPRTGHELWKVRHDGWSNVPRPVFGLGLVYIVNDFERPQLYAIRPGGDGDVTESHVAWQMQQGVPAQPSLLLIGPYLYGVTDLGVALCLQATTGEQVWKERLGGSFAASPIYANGRIYYFAQDGTTSVIQPGTEFKVLATNTLDGEIKATPAVADGAIFLRTRTHLYRIDE